MTINRLFRLLVASGCLLAVTLLHADTRKATKTVPPVYPALALKMRIEGTVKLEASINDDGTVDNIKIISGHSLLVPAAVDAVKKWHYESGIGKSTQVVSVDFALPH
jgi:TonB family protein